MKLQNKIVLSLLMLSLTTQPLMALELTTIADTFTANNIENTISNRVNATYMITNTNTVKAVGTNIRGVGENLISSREWVDVVKSATGQPLDNIVKIHAAGNGLIFLDKNGDVYWSGDFNTLGQVDTKKSVRKIEELSNIVDMAQVVVRKTVGAGRALYLNSSGQAFMFGEGQPLINVTPDEGALKDIFDGTGTAPSFVAIDEDNVLYKLVGNKFKKATTKSGLPITNIEEAYPLSEEAVLLRTIDGKVYTYTVGPSNLTEILFYKDKKKIESPKVQNLISSAIYNFVIPDSNILLADTNQGYFKIDSTGTKFEYQSFDFNPVAIIKNYLSPAYILLDDKGIVHAFGNDNSGITGTGQAGEQNGNTYQFEWMNNNPIVSDSVLAKFNLKHNSILDRKYQYDIQFSLVANNKPIAFNLYYTKVGTVADRSQWQVIQRDVPYEALNPIEYDTGYIDNRGNRIIGKMYSYTWNVENEDLTNIQLIAEPVY